jgi:hypothetical protein
MAALLVLSRVGAIGVGLAAPCLPDFKVHASLRQFVGIYTTI